MGRTILTTAIWTLSASLFFSGALLDGTVVALVGALNQWHGYNEWSKKQ